MGCTRPSVSGRRSSTMGRTRRSRTSSTPPPHGSSGTTMNGSTRGWATPRPSSSSRATTPRSTESFNPHRSGGKPGAVHPNPEAFLRLATSVVIDQHDEWQVGRRYLSETSMGELRAVIAAKQQALDASNGYHQESELVAHCD